METIKSMSKINIDPDGLVDYMSEANDDIMKRGTRFDACGNNVEYTGPMVTTIRIPMLKRKDWSKSFLLTSDRHFDNALSDINMQVRHLKEAQEKNAGILDFGDFFCAMQSKGDPRSRYNDLRPEHKGDDYFDRLVRHGKKVFAPYADNFIMIGTGNHERNVVNRHGINLTNHIAKEIGDSGSHPVIPGGIHGFVRFQFKAPGGSSQSRVLYWHHGSGQGGGGQRGTGKVSRRAAVLNDVDIVVSGHIHEAWQMDVCRYTLTQQGRVRVDTQMHCCLPTYKYESHGQEVGWWVENEYGPRPLGGWWLNFSWSEADQQIKTRLIRAD